MFAVEYVHAYSWACAHLCMRTLSVVHVHVFSCMCTLLVEHVHALSCACACFQLSIQILQLSMCNAFSWASTCFGCQWACVRFSSACSRLHLSMWILPVEHTHFQFSTHTSVDYVAACIWACTYLTMFTLTLEPVHACFWACAHFQLSMCTLSLEHAHAFSWACSHFQLSMCTLVLEHVHASI